MTDTPIDRIIEAVVLPLFTGAREGNGGIKGPKEGLDLLDRVEDLELCGGDLFRSSYLDDHRSLLRSILAEDDRLEKRGRSLHFKIQGSRSFEPPGSSLTIALESPFTLEFFPAEGPVSAPDVAERFEKDLISLKERIDFSPEEVLAVGVLPQTKKLLGLHTPISAEVFGFRLCLRFLVAIFHAPRIRLFGVGPTIREITF
jgi:hypothetical protein